MDGTLKQSASITSPYHSPSPPLAPLLPSFSFSSSPCPVTSLLLPLLLLLQLQLSSSLNATVELMTPYYLICSCSTIAGLQLAYGLMDTVSRYDVCIKGHGVHVCTFLT